jgi:heterodisulfide reductase subunit C
MISSIIFFLCFVAGVTLFSLNAKKIYRNITLGRSIDRFDQPNERLMKTIKVALGQSKMVVRPIAGFLHIIVYLGFVIINLEVLEIVIDGIFGTHRFFASFMGGFYNFLIGSFEILAFGVLAACVIFLIRRNVINIRRFQMSELLGWPKNDANIILVVEILLMSAFLTMNASDRILQLRGAEHYIQAGAYPISQFIMPLLQGLSDNALISIERFTWWFHILGILAFLNYLPYSKHLHIMLAFPAVYFSNLNKKGKFTNMESVTNEVKLMFDPSATPPDADAPIGKFGAKDVHDLSWKSLLDAYTCTECGRCTSECPANNTGKLLSPRKIMISTRDRLEEVGKNIDKHGVEYADGKTLLGDYITAEELWACTTCNACTEACPVNLDPLAIIVDLRRYLVMEEATAPSELTNMFTNVENNGAPWQFSQADRFNWAKEN